MGFYPKGLGDEPANKQKYCALDGWESIAGNTITSYERRNQAEGGLDK